MVCSDFRFPEVYRELALKGANVIVCASAFLSPRFDHWEFFLRARAAENQCWVIASGQVGFEPKSGTGYVGRSMAVDPIDPAVVLDEVAEIIRRYVVLEKEQADAAALWIAMTHELNRA